MDIFDLNLYNYHLPEGLISNKLVIPRDQSKLMIVDSRNKRFETGLVFGDILKSLNDDYVIVRNNTKVYPAKLILTKRGSGTMLEMLFTRHVDGTQWEVICKRAKKAKLGDVFTFSFLGKLYDFRICDRLDEGLRMVDVGMKKDDFLLFLDKVGLVPIPPYIEKDMNVDYKKDYQTKYAKNVGSVAAPTAGFHFSKELDDNLKEKGVNFEEVTLHVGLGTFMPVRSEDLRDHKMHEEQMMINKEVLQRLNEYKMQGKKILTVGTTTTRFLESLVNENGFLEDFGRSEVMTDLFVYPGYEFKFVDELITNFHLPKSTLLMLVAGFLNDKGNFEKKLDSISFLKKIYNQAILERYRFYSFGDAMWVK